MNKGTKIIYEEISDLFYNRENLEEFVANSENDILYKNAVQNYELNHYDENKRYFFIALSSYNLDFIKQNYKNTLKNLKQKLKKLKLL